MPEKKFELGDYVEVKDRIKLFYELYAGGRLVTTEVRTELGPDGTPRVVVGAAAYRTSDDPLPGRGWSWMALPGTTPYTHGSELENTETSAWGRAIAATGILIDRSIASAQEVENKSGAQNGGLVSTKEYPIDRIRTPEGGLIGIAVSKDRYDMNLRQSPDQEWVWPFRVKNGSASFGVVAEGDLAEALDAIKATVIDQRVTVWGHWSDEVTPAKGVKPEIKWRLLHLERIATPDGILPASDKALDQPPDDVELPGERDTVDLGLAG